ncbi:MAG: FAD binding domain-containing protein [Thaumarchaeota archaeon]|nr:FAD binding domain-containing protein [Nitrososphaerota archaeon]
MPLFRPEDFLMPGDAEEALQRLRSEGKRAHVIAGGTGFYELARRGYIPEVKSVVSIMKLGLAYVRQEGSQVRIGATTTLQTLLESGAGGLQGLEAVGDSLHEIRPVQVRNVATVGGEVCISVPLVDLPTALLACEASLTILSAGGAEREASLDGFYIDAFLTRLRYGEIVKEVKLPAPSSHTVHSAFVKFGRTSYDFNLINAAASLSLEGERVKQLRVFVGGIGRAPVRANELEKRLRGRTLDERSIMEAAKASFEEKELLPSVHGSKEYKFAILPVVLRDCILKAQARAMEGSSS